MQLQLASAFNLQLAQLAELTHQLLLQSFVVCVGVFVCVCVKYRWNCCQAMSAHYNKVLTFVHN